MASARVLLAQIDADLAEARQRHEDLQYAWAVASYTSSGTRRPEDIDVDLARVAAQIAELEERRESLASAPANDVAPAPEKAAGAPAEPAAECVDTKGAARILGVSPRTLEGLRLRGEGPPSIKLGSRVLYPLATLRTWPAK
jgi:hypothetical protein